MVLHPSGKPAVVVRKRDFGNRVDFNYHAIVGVAKSNDVISIISKANWGCMLPNDYFSVEHHCTCMCISSWLHINHELPLWFCNSLRLAIHHPIWGRGVGDSSDYAAREITHSTSVYIGISSYTILYGYTQKWQVSVVGGRPAAANNDWIHQ